MAAVGKVAPAVWFEHLFGFKEHLALRQQLPNGQIVRNPAHLREKLELRGDRLVSLVNGASYGVGTFSAPSLSELRRRVAAANLPPGQLQLSHTATRDVFSLHSQPEYRGATFMAASQFNCLEFSNPEVVPEDGVQNYVYDATQGPACALAAPAAAVVRHYHIPVGGEVGQSAERQLNLVSGLLQAVQGTDGEQWRRRGGAVEAEAVDLVCVRNGYSTSDESRLLELNRRWRAACEQAPLTARDEAMGQMCIGVHAGVEVPWGPPRFMLLPLEQRQSVTQVRRLRAAARRACMHARDPGLLRGPTYTHPPAYPHTHTPPTHRRRPTARPSRWATQKAARRRGHPSRSSFSRRAPRYLVITPRPRGELFTSDHPYSNSPPPPTTHHTTLHPPPTTHHPPPTTHSRRATRRCCCAPPSTRRRRTAAASRCSPSWAAASSATGRSGSRRPSRAPWCAATTLAFLPILTILTLARLARLALLLLLC